MSVALLSNSVDWEWKSTSLITEHFGTVSETHANFRKRFSNYVCCFEIKLAPLFESVHQVFDMLGGST